MANNPYVNKVVYGSNTLIDISDTTATASDVASGKYFYTAAGQKVQGSASTGSIVISDTTDSHGGTIRTITTGQTVNLQTKTITPSSSQQTINPDSGYNGFSQVIVEASSGGGGSVTQDANGYIVLPPTGGSSSPTLITKTITQNGTYAASSDNASGYSQVTVNVSTVMNVISTSATNSTTLTFNNIQKQPSQFVVVLADFIVTPGYAKRITVHSNEIPYIYYNGTSTNALYTSIASYSLALWELDSGILTWTYSGTQKKLTFTISNTNSNYIYFNLEENGGKYVLYYV